MEMIFNYLYADEDEEGNDKKNCNKRENLYMDLY